MIKNSPVWGFEGTDTLGPWKACAWDGGAWRAGTLKNGNHAWWKTSSWSFAVAICHIERKCALPYNANKLKGALSDSKIDSTAGAYNLILIEYQTSILLEEKCQNNSWEASCWSRQRCETPSLSPKARRHRGIPGTDTRGDTDIDRQRQALRLTRIWTQKLTQTTDTDTGMGTVTNWTR